MGDVLHVGTATTLAALDVASFREGDIAYIWLNEYTRKMILDKASNESADVVNHPYYIEANDYVDPSALYVWVEDVGADQPEAWSADQTKTGSLDSTNLDTDEGSTYDLDDSVLKLGGSAVNAAGTVSGVFLGLDSGAYKAYIGDGSNKYFKFDGIDFELNLTNLIISSSDQAIALNKSGYTDDTTGIWFGLHGGDYKMYIGKDSGYMKYNATDGMKIKGDIDASNITGGTIVGANIATAVSGRRMIMTTEGIQLISTDASGKYGSFKYGSGTKYGTGVRAWIWNSIFDVPFYIVSGSAHADFHFYNRVAEPSGAAEEADVCVVSEMLKICTAAGTPGTWKALAMEAGGTGGSGSAGAGNQYVEINIDGTTYKCLHDGTV